MIAVLKSPQCLLLSAVFLFIPMGCLPAFLNFPYSIFAVFLLILIAMFTEFCAHRNVPCKIWVNTILASVFILCLMQVALMCGFPGYVFSLNMLSCVNLWRYCDFVGCLFAVVSGFFLLFVAFCGAKVCDDMFFQLFVSVCCAVFVSFALIPAVVCGFGCNIVCNVIFWYAFFWCAVLILKQAVFKIARTATAK